MKPSLNRRALLLAGCVVVYLVHPGTYADDNYKVDPVDASFVYPNDADFDKSSRDGRQELYRKTKEVRDARTEAERVTKDVIRGTGDLNSGRAEFTKYFTGLVLPEMTMADDKSLYSLGDRRKDLMKLVSEAVNGSPAREYLLTQVLLPNLIRVADDTGYHPAVRLNAIILIGSLDRREGERNTVFPNPLDAASKYLASVADDPKRENFLRIGALSGLLRQAGIDGQAIAAQNGSGVLDDSVRQSLITLAENTLDAAAADFSALSDEQYWMCRQLTQILGGLRSPGADGKVVNSLRQLIENDQTPPLLMLDAISAYSTLRFADQAQADSKKMALLIGQRAKEWLLGDAGEVDQYITGIKENRLLAEKTKPVGASNRNTNDNQSTDLQFGTSGGGGTTKGGARNGRGNAAAGPASKSSEVTFPNYRINDIREHIKALTYACRLALDGTPPRRREAKNPENLKRFADDTTKSTIDRLVAVLDKVMDETDLTSSASQGLLGDNPDPPEKRLKEILERNASNLDRVLGTVEAKTSADVIPSSATGN